MEITEVIAHLKDKFGDKFDVTKVTEALKSFDHSKMNMSEIVEKIKAKGLVGDLDGDGKVESTFEELKGKAEQMFGNMFHKG